MHLWARRCAQDRNIITDRTKSPARVLFEWFWQVAKLGFFISPTQWVKTFYLYCCTDGKTADLTFQECEVPPIHPLLARQHSSARSSHLEFLGKAPKGHREPRVVTWCGQCFTITYNRNLKQRFGWRRSIKCSVSISNSREATEADH